MMLSSAFLLVGTLLLAPPATPRPSPARTPVLSRAGTPVPAGPTDVNRVAGSMRVDARAFENFNPAPELDLGPASTPTPDALSAASLTGPVPTPDYQKLKAKWDDWNRKEYVAAKITADTVERCPLSTEKDKQAAKARLERATKAVDGPLPVVPHRK